MFNAAHILETALIMLAAFLIGAAAGTLIRLAARTLRRKPVATVSSALVAPTAAAEPALVIAPVIDPINAPAVPVASNEVPVPDFAETMIALANAPLPEIRQMPAIAPLPPVEGAAPPAIATVGIEPARTAGETTSGRHIASPLENARPLTPVISDATKSADILPFPSEATALPSLTDVAAELESLLTQAVAADAEAPKSADPPPEDAEEATPVAVVEGSSSPEVAVEGSRLSGPEALTIEAEAPAADSAPVPVEIAEAAATPDPDVVATVDVVSDSELPAGLVVAEQAAVETPQSAPASETPEAAQVAPAESPVEAKVLTTEAPEPVAAKRSPEEDEAAAMRAIEGNWSPRQKGSRPRRAAPAPDGIADAGDAVKASGAAVAAAAEAANAVVEAIPDPNRPAGIPAPRNGRRDELTNVIGILPIIETALNTLGIYHFDQVADLNDKQMAWVETHLGIDGRISREHWREQAVELAALTNAKVAAET